MPDRILPDRPNLEQYKKQAKDLVRDCRSGSPEAWARFHGHHPDHARAPVSLTAAQLVIAREHGFGSWPKFAAHIETLRIQRAVESLADPVSGFLIAACVPRDGSNHTSGTLEEAETILSQYPHVGAANICTAAVLGNEQAALAFLSAGPKLATAPGGPYAWDALTYLCFSRYLRIDRDRSEAFVRTARVLLDAGASPNTGWTEMWQGKPEFESVIYGAAGAAHHPGMTRLLLEYGANPNDGETCYHAPESYDNTVTQILLESGKLNDRSRTWILVRKADWHDYNGVKLALDNGADPNAIPQWGNSALQHSVQRDNRIEIIGLLLDRGADPLLGNGRDGRSAAVMAARRGRGDILALLRERGVDPLFAGVDRLIAACAFNLSSETSRISCRDYSRKAELYSPNLPAWVTRKACAACLTLVSRSTRSTPAIFTSTSRGTQPRCMWPHGAPGLRPQSCFWSAAPMSTRSMARAARPCSAPSLPVSTPTGRTAVRLIGLRLSSKQAQPLMASKSPAVTRKPTNY